MGMFKVEQFVWVLNPEEKMLGPVESGDLLEAVTPPGCWGPMITPDFPSGHEVTKPIAVQDAEPGDAIAIKIERIDVLSQATTSGIHKINPEYVYGNDPYVGKKCPTCNTINPATIVVGSGPDSVRCKSCNTPIKTCEMKTGYTMIFDHRRKFGITITEKKAKEIRSNADKYSALPVNSKQHSANLLANGQLPGIIARVKPLIGNIGTVPDCVIPASHNAGDLAGRLVNDLHPNSIKPEDLKTITDGHLDNNYIVEGTTVICPVNVKGGGVYLGDVHAMQNEGETAGHTTDVTAKIRFRINLFKSLDINGPIIIPPKNLLPELVKPLSYQEKKEIESFSKSLRIPVQNTLVPLFSIGTGKNIEEAIDCAINRLSSILNMNLDEVKNRLTISGCIGIGRLPGTIHAAILIPKTLIENKDLHDLLFDYYIS